MLKSNLLLAFLVTFILTVSTLPAWGDSTNDNNAQTNSSGSNTQITGGYTSTTTNNNDGQTNTTTSTTTNNSTTNGSYIPVNSANSPSFSSMSQDVCSMGISGSVSTLGVGLSGGKHIRDLNCERIKLSKVLFDFNMKIAAVSLLCQDERVCMAMKSAGTPCPWDGKIGPDAQAMWDKYPELRPDYEEFLAKSEAIAKIDERILREEAKELARLEAERLKKDLSREALLQTIFAKIPGMFTAGKKMIFGKADDALYNSAKRQGFPLSLSESGNIIAKGYGKVIGVFAFVGNPIKSKATQAANFINKSADDTLNKFGPNVTLTKLGIDMTKASQKTYGEFRRVSSFFYDDFYKAVDAVGNTPIISTQNFKNSLKNFAKLVDDFLTLLFSFFTFVGVVLQWTM